jgi:hypothetical protein
MSMSDKKKQKEKKIQTPSSIGHKASQSDVFIFPRVSMTSVPLILHLLYSNMYESFQNVIASEKNEKTHTHTNKRKVGIFVSNKNRQGEARTAHQRRRSKYEVEPKTATDWSITHSPTPR